MCQKFFVVFFRPSRQIPAEHLRICYDDRFLPLYLKISDHNYPTITPYNLKLNKPKINMHKQMNELEVSSCFLKVIHTYIHVS
jgi:hypothetical protein